jgi:hypothetical protein
MRWVTREFSSAGKHRERGGSVMNDVDRLEGVPLGLIYSTVGHYMWI